MAYSCLLVNVSHIHIKPLLSPVAKYYPVGETARERTGAEWPEYMIIIEVGNGFNVLGSGSLGTSASGSIFNFFFFTLGHRYKSKHRWNLSWMKLS